ncbi:DUF2790 domain-containing protein [Stutzerimonas azotifigens]|uniref:DUF2790 domain-containing protein n=1 Tax=Stutzerimonas azotifigens TaxID=291995 RepID=A0ABR5YZA3_9GAMM|nr:DUF2790 domain-containing protein [Stutzerimonas azotifigens]MBA1273320.1 DUF2790 domain-containing protein [Stutzerimonas azotifigens]
MDHHTRFILFALPLLPFAGLSYADERSESERYRYGDRLDIAHVLRIEQPATASCEVVDETMVYLDSDGAERRLTARALSQACQHH